MRESLDLCLRQQTEDIEITDMRNTGTEHPYADAKALIVGGAGFVGSNLARGLLNLPAGPERIIVVENLLSAERENLPADDRIEFIEASINDDGVLAAIPRDLDYAFHLATYQDRKSVV